MAGGPPSTEGTGFPVAITIPILFRDIDMMGHVNNAVFVTMMEQARVAYCEQLPGFAFSQITYPIGLSFILASIHCDFKAPVGLGATVQIRVGVTGMRRSSFAMAYELHDATSGALVAAGTSTQVVFDYAKKQPVPIPADLRQRVGELERWAKDDPRRAVIEPP